MLTFLHHIAKPLAEISKMYVQPVWPTKIILRLLAANLSTTANQVSATSGLIQQNQHGDYKKNDMASFAEQKKRCTRRRWSRTESFLSECKFLIFERIFSKKSFNLRNLPSRTSTLIVSFTAERFDPFLNCDQLNNLFKEFSGKLTFYTLCSRKVRYGKEIYVFINVS